MAAARVIGRAGRRWAGKRLRKFSMGRRPAKRQKRANKRLFSKSHIGEAIGSTTCKYDNVLDVTETRVTRVLYKEELTKFVSGTANNQRLRNVIDFRGARICIEMKNVRPEPIRVNIAVVGIKGQTKNQAEPDEERWFRGSGDARYMAFSNSRTSIEFACNPINTDEYVVLKHKRFTLMPGETANDNPAVGRNFKEVKMYIPIKRQLRFDTNNTSPEEGKVWLVFWCDAWEANAGTLSNSAIEYRSKKIVYFRESKS